MPDLSPEKKIHRVLDFLQKELGDDDATIVYGDTDDKEVFFYSNRPLIHGEYSDGAYMKCVGNPSYWHPGVLEDFESRFLWDGRYSDLVSVFVITTPSKDGHGFDVERMTISSRDLSAAERLMGINGPYGWNHSVQLGKLVKPGCEVPEEFKFPDDWVMCHEAAHQILQKHDDFSRMVRLKEGKWASDREVMGEALAHNISCRYMEMFHPHYVEYFREYMKNFDGDHTHKEAF